MSRASIVLTAAFSLLLCSFAFSQTNTTGTPPTRPGSATGAALPGMPSLGPRTPQTGTGRNRRRIVAAQTGVPLRRAQVTLGVPAAPGRSTITDNEGRFEFAQLPAGRYAIVATRLRHAAIRPATPHRRH